MNKFKIAGKLINNLQSSGDQDECSMKHVVNGLCILYIGKDPSDQSLYVDYDNSGTSYEDWMLYEADNNHEPKAVFRKDLWSELYLLVNSMDDNTKKMFYKAAHPYCDIKDDHWMTYYNK